MPIPIKAPAEINAMRPAARLAWSLLGGAVVRCAPGVTTAQIERHLREQMEESGAEPILRGIRQSTGGPAFPACCCVCLNEEAAHGIPGPRILREGDVVSIDVSLRLDGWCADAARAAVVGGAEVKGHGHALAAAARAAARAVAAAMHPGVRWSLASGAAAGVARGAGLRLAAGLSGHGIGRGLHEPPEAWFGISTGLPGAQVQDFILRPGMVLTVEPVLVSPGHGEPTLLGLDDGFTVVTGDRARACHEEIMVAVTRDGPEVLTA
ncbi:MAG: M24 family metallopeptidase [Phycisphaerales bacterium]|nr:M24 family metallopeptidase [Phycisphaerales bacterium]